MSTSSPAQNKKDALLEIAADLFYTQGFHATGIKQIIEAAGIAKGTFYSHYKSKDEIGLAWLRRRHHQWNGMLHEHLAGLKQTPRAQLLGLYSFLEEWMQNCNYRGCAFLNALSELPLADHPMREEIRNHKQDLRELIHDMVKAHFTAKTPAQRRLLADQIFLSFEGAIVESQNFSDTWPIATARRQLESLL